MIRLDMATRAVKVTVQQYCNKGRENRINNKVLASIVGVNPSSLSNMQREDASPPRADVWLAILDATRELDKLVEQNTLPLSSNKMASQTPVLSHFGISEGGE